MAGAPSGRAIGARAILDPRARRNVTAREAFTAGDGDLRLAQVANAL
jgi:hypothetical protein